MKPTDDDEAHWLARDADKPIQVHVIPHPGPGPHAMPTWPTALAIDTHQELIWTGNEYVWDVARDWKKGC
jgi:hypothetical protein